MSSVSRLFEKPWLWAFVAAIAVWVATITFTQGQGAGDVLTAAFSFATFSVIVALGQMMVITLGPGNVDLSIPATMTLAGTVAMKVMNGAPGMLPVGLAAALAVGLVVGAANYALIRLLRIPPIIATLSSSFIFQSMAIWWNRGLRVKPPAALADFTPVAAADTIVPTCGSTALSAGISHAAIIASSGLAGRQRQVEEIPVVGRIVSATPPAGSNVMTVVEMSGRVCERRHSADRLLPGVTDLPGAGNGSSL